jgi:hypothetical protein
MPDKDRICKGDPRMNRDISESFVRPPGLRLLYRSEVRIGDPIEIGPSPTGIRRTIPITGGTFTGPRMSGRILPGGADWQILRHDGITEVDARYTLETVDGGRIHVSNRGLRHGPYDVMKQLAAGLPVEPERYYFRTVPVFETGAPSLSWLNGVVAVATGERHPEVVVITVFEVL